MNYVILVFLFFAFVGILLAVLFQVKKKGDRLANFLLGVYTLLFAFEMINNCLRWSGLLESSAFVHINLTHFPLWLMYGAIVYIYVRRVVTGKGLQWMDLLFVLPPVTIFVMLSPFFFLSSVTKLEVVQAGRTFEYAYFPSYTIWLVILGMFFYAFFTYFKFWQNGKLGLRESTWLKWFVGSYLGFVITFFSYIFLVRFKIMDPSFDYLIDLFIVFFIGQLAFFGFVQPEVFAGKTVREVIPFVKYQKTGMTSNLAVDMKRRLKDLMDQEKPYLNNELRLNDIAEHLNLSRNHTSQVINEQFNLSFFDFINRYRIEAAKELLLKNMDQKRTISEIAYDVGFNNRASFYKAFKKFESRSPSEFIRNCSD